MRARNMQALTDAIKRRWPGVVIYGIGDAAHQDSPSDHNEDDTAGSRPAQTDADSNPEHRAIDVMVGPAFTRADGDWLVNALLASSTARARLQNIIWYRHIWSRSWGWTRRDYTGSNPHTDHPHISGHAADDENAAAWTMIEPEGTMTPAEFAEILTDPTVAARMRALPWQYVGGGIPTGMSTLGVVNELLTLARADKGGDDALMARINELAAAEQQRDTELRDLLEQHQSGQLSAEAVVAKMGEMLTGAAGTPSTTEPTS